MARLSIIYYSSTGNTEQMATYIEEGAKEKGIEVEMVSVDSAMGDDNLMTAEYIALGSSAAGAEEIAPEMLEFIDNNKDKFQEKNLVLFGSYDWGNGEFMDLWVDEMKEHGSKILMEPLIINLAPDDDEKIEAAKEYGRKIVKN